MALAFPSSFSRRTLAAIAALGAPLAALATLERYDAAVAADADAGLPTAAVLSEALDFDGSGGSAFDFGPTSGAVTMEFVVEGDPGGGRDGYLAVGANTTSNLRYEQWDDTGQLGFTQLGVEDYLFTPAVPSPREPAHVTYVWDGSSRMDLFLDGALAGTRTGATPAFEMPSGAGFLGANPSGAEAMVGTVHRVTVYDQAVSADVIARHADAFNDVVRAPVIRSFAASPPAFFSPGSAELTWEVEDAEALDLDGEDVNGAAGLTVSPSTTRTFTLTARNAGGSVSAEVTVSVDPPPVVSAFAADLTRIVAGQEVRLTWSSEFALEADLAPGVGAVPANGSAVVRPEVTTRYTLEVRSPFGSGSAEVEVTVAAPAEHLVIAEFMADNRSTVADDEGAFSDWIEVFNPTAAEVDLAGYALTDDPDDPLKWVFPPRLLGPGQHLLVFASGRDRGGAAAELHTNFRLAREGEYLALVAPGGAVLHAFAPAYPEQGPDVSYGVLGAELDAPLFMGAPTPGAPNDETPPAPGAVVFSEPDQFFSGRDLVVELSAPAGAAIRYTTDGGEPHLLNSSVYRGPLTISTTTELRASASTAGGSGPVSGARYIRLTEELAAYASDLPLMVIENFGRGSVPAKGWSGTGSGVRQVERQAAYWAFFERGGGGEAALTDPPQSAGRIGIRGRGAFSSTWRQKPYSVEAWDEAGAEDDIAVLGMPPHPDWVLYYPDVDDRRDPSMMFNTVIYEMSQNIGRYSTRFRFVEAFVNEDGGDLGLADRRGVYAVMEKVSRGRDRLDFEPLSADGSTGGWLLGLNRMDAVPPGGWPAENGATRPQFFHTAGPDRVLQTPPNSSGVGDDIPRQSNGFLNFENPNGYKINPDQRAAIEGWFVTFEDVLYDDGLWRDPGRGYRRYLDPLDFVDYFIFNNLSRNGDGMLISMFPWLSSRDGKLRMGPTWDYNWSSFYVGGGPTGTTWHRADRLWYGRLFDDPDFRQLYIDRWAELRDGALGDAGIAAVVDGQGAEIGADRAVRQGISSPGEWQNRVDRLRDWLVDRARWLDGQYPARPAYLVPGGDVAEGFRVGFSPSAGSLYYTIDGSDPRAPGGAPAAGARTLGGGFDPTVLLAAGAPLRARVPDGSAGDTDLGWTGLAFADAGWTSGAGGAGYDELTTYRPFIGLDLEADMNGVNTGVYLRYRFTLEAPPDFDALTLRMRYDDGFVAYLNGVEIASDNDPQNLAWDSGATNNHADAAATEFADFPVDGHLGLLLAGENILAVHGLNAGIGSSDFLIEPELVAGTASETDGLSLSGSTVVTARALTGSGWSAPSAAVFYVGAVPAAAGNLSFSEVHYRPADASAGETVAGFTDRDDFEFIELVNTGAQPVKLDGVRLVRDAAGAGVEFDFTGGTVRWVEPGERVLVVRDRAAFEARYGQGTAALIAGAYSGNLSNDGETLTLVDASGTPIQAFTYNDQPPWPEEADGDGFSLVFSPGGGGAGADPSAPADPAHWRPSLAFGGSPGAGDGTVTYESWRAAAGLAPPGADPGEDSDGDGLPDLLEYATGTPPLLPDGAGPPLTVGVESIGLGGDGGAAADFLLVRVARNLAADDLSVNLESSPDLLNWAPGDLVLLRREREGGAPVEVRVYRSSGPIGEGGGQFVRLRVAR